MENLYKVIERSRRLILGAGRLGLDILLDLGRFWLKHRKVKEYAFPKLDVDQVKSALYPYDTHSNIRLSNTFVRLKAPGTDRLAVQLTSGSGFCYPLYYFIPSITKDLRYLMYHQSNEGVVQLYRLDLHTGQSVQITEATVVDSSWYPWDSHGKQKGVLDHRSVLNVAMNKVVYFTGRQGREARVIDIGTLAENFLFELPEGREAIGQNCCTPNGQWFVYIHAPCGSQKPKKCKGAVLSAYNFETKEHRILTTINSAIHHVQPYGNERFIFCHPPSVEGMMMATIHGGPWVRLRDQDFGSRGRVCHQMTTAHGVAFEARTGGISFEASGHLSGLYNPVTRECFEFSIPREWRYTHTGWDPEGKFWFWEASHRHHLEYLKNFDQQGKPRFERLTGQWHTYGDGQKSHFHPQLTPDRNWIMFVGGDAKTKSNHIFLLDVSDLKDHTAFGSGV